MNFIRIRQQDGELIFESLKRAELLIVNNENNLAEIYINIESDNQTEIERNNISERYETELNNSIKFAIPKLQFMNIDNVDEFLGGIIEIKKGWGDEFLMAGVYVGWGIETFDNIIQFSRIDSENIKINWTCLTDDLNYYDDRAKNCKAEIRADLKVLKFATKEDFWIYEKDKMEGKK
jgi:hypothetical protein